MNKSLREENFEKQYDKISSKFVLTITDLKEFEEWYFKYTLFVDDLKRSRKKWRERALEAEETLKEVRHRNNNSIKA